MIVIAVVAGILVGISLGALGGGGAIITVPVLVYVLGQSAHEATTSSLVIVGVTAFIAAITHARAGRVRWVQGLIFGAGPSSGRSSPRGLRRTPCSGCSRLSSSSWQYCCGAEPLRRRDLSMTLKVGNRLA